MRDPLVWLGLVVIAGVVGLSFAEWLREQRPIPAPSMAELGRRGLWRTLYQFNHTRRGRRV